MAANNDAKGALFKDTNKKSEKGPDWTGNVELTVPFLQAALQEAQGGGAYKARLVAWIRQGPNGMFLSVSLNAPFKKESGAPQAGKDRYETF